MKKLMILELGALALLLVVAVLVSGRLDSPVFGPDPYTPPVMSDSANTDPTTQPTEFVPTWNTYPADRQLLAQQYFVYDCRSNNFLMISGKENERVYPASITKLFTAYVAMLFLEPDTPIVAGNELDLVAWGSSVAKIKKGDTLTAQQLIEAMILPSGNDAAYMLANKVGCMISKNPQLSASGAVQVFVDEMNNRAKLMGMTDTHFVNPDGIHDPNHYTTFADLVLLGKLSIGNPTIMRFASAPKETVILHGESIDWKNTNALIDSASPYYCPYAIGLKTGQTPSAGSCLLSAFRKDGQTLLIGVFGCPEEEDRFDDTLQLFNQIVLN